MRKSAKASGDRSIAAGESIRLAQTGDGSFALYAEKALSVPPEAFALPEAPAGMVNLPEQAALFVGRERELAALDEAFENTGGVVVQAVHGLGGIGKSTLAARWAAGRTSSYNPVWWITAETPVDLESGLAGLAVALQPALRDVLSPEALAERAVQWLASHEGWLLILDNVSDPADVKPLLGRTTGGRFLITTRRATGWHGVAEPVSLDLLAPAEAEDLFRRIHADGGDGVADLCAKLGYLPLAVEQAAAYCAEARISARAYLDLLARHPDRVLAGAAEGGDSERTIARVWSVTMDRLADTPLAQRVLEIIAWWAPEGIPREYLAPIGDEHAVTEALRRLAAHSMIALREDGTISVHRLVQAVTRGMAVRDEAAILLSGRGDMLDSPVWIKHAETMVEQVRTQPASEATVLLMLSVGIWHGGHLASERQAAINKPALESAERDLGPRHEITLQARRFYANSCADSGDVERAVILLKANLSESRRALGRTSVETFETRGALAEVMMAQGNVEGGMALAKKNARWAERSLGISHDASQSAVWTLVKGWRMRAEADPDRYATRAATEVERLLARLMREVGGSNAVVVYIMREASLIRAAAGDFQGAIRAATDFLRHHSALPDHSDGTHLMVRFQIALWYAASGDRVRARELAVPLSDETERILGNTQAGTMLRELLSEFLTGASGD